MMERIRKMSLKELRALEAMNIEERDVSRFVDCTISPDSAFSTS